VEPREHDVLAAVAVAIDRIDDLIAAAPGRRSHAVESDQAALLEVDPRIADRRRTARPRDVTALGHPRESPCQIALRIANIDHADLGDAVVLVEERDDLADIEARPGAHPRAVLLDRAPPRHRT